MDVHKKWFWLAGVLLFAAGLISLPAPDIWAAQQEGVLVGRIAHVEGQILRYVPDTKDWVATVKDAPFGMEDALYSDQAGRAEFIMPNGIWVRIGGSTQIQMIALKSDASEFDVASGSARFYNKSSDGMLRVTTPFGSILSEPNSTYDLYVGDQSLEVIALNGAVDFIHQKTNSRVNVVPGSGSVIADANQVAAGDGTVDAAWDDWNASRDSVWTKRVQVKGDSVQYLPPQLHDEAYSLEENGRWEKVYYEGEYQQFWRPSNVDPGWQPFTMGRWTDWYGDQCWVPTEPFGYVTHHYGNWVMVNGAWFWSPPRHHRHLVAFGWYPGRVAWLHHGSEVGWVPLAPTEVYYGHHAWGPSAVVVSAAAPAPVIAVASLAFVAAAIVVPQQHFWGVQDYHSVRVTNINKTVIVNNYQAAPVVNNTVINNYSSNTTRYNITNTAVAAKPHAVVTERIQQNQQVAVKEARTANANSFRQTLSTTKAVTPPPTTQAGVKPPQVTNKIVPANQVNAPKSQVQFKPAEIKQTTKPAPVGVTAPGAQPGRPGQTTTGQMPGKPGETPSGTQPGRPGTQPPSVTGPQPTKPGETPATGIQPTRPGETPSGTQPGRPGIQPPSRPGQPGQPATGSQPTKPGETPATGIQPTRPGETPSGTQPGRPGIQPPSRPGQPGQPATGSQPTKPGETPATGIQPTRPGETPSGTQPGRPGIQPPTRPGQQPTRPGETPGTGIQPTRPGETPSGTQPGRPGVQPPSRPGDQPQRPSSPGMTTPSSPSGSSPSTPFGRPPQQSTPTTQPQRPSGPGMTTPSSPSSSSPFGRPPQQSTPSVQQPPRMSSPPATQPQRQQPPAMQQQPQRQQPPAMQQQPQRQQPPAVQQQPQRQQPPAVQQQPQRQQPPAVQQQPQRQQPPAVQQQPQRQQPPAMQPQRQQPPAQQQQQQKKKPGEPDKQ